MDEGPPEAVREVVRVPTRCVGGVTVAEPEVQAVGFVPELAHQVPEAEGVLPARHRDEDALTRLHHVEVVDRAPDLLPAMVQETVAAERRVVPADIDDRGLTAAPALHAA